MTNGNFGRDGNLVYGWLLASSIFITRPGRNRSKREGLERNKVPWRPLVCLTRTHYDNREKICHYQPPCIRPTQHVEIDFKV